MNTFKNLPIEYKGELHEIHLINFTVDPAEVEPYLPPPLKLRLFNGRAMISMVDVSLRKMHPRFLPGLLHFNYQHVAFRLLIEDSEYNEDGTHKGIYFLRSFTDKPLIVTGGQLTTNYNLEQAGLMNLPRGLEVRQGEEVVSYNLLGSAPSQLPGADRTPVYIKEADTGAKKRKELHRVIGAIDRAYTADEHGRVFKTQIMREKWPLVPMEVQSFKCTFFKTAKLEGVFKVPEVIHYRWLPQKEVKKCA